MKLTKNFRKREFDCKDGSEMPESVLDNVSILAVQLQYVRDYLDKPIKVNSGYRSPQHNKSVGGSPKSQHLLGKAADIKVKGFSPNIIYELLNDLMDKGDILQGGLGIYNTFVHYDFRGERVRWDLRK